MNKKIPIALSQPISPSLLSTRRAALRRHHPKAAVRSTVLSSPPSLARTRERRLLRSLLSGRAVAAFAALLISAPAAAEDAGGGEGLARQRARIVEVMKDLKLEAFIGKDKPLCQAFYEDFKKQNNIEYIAPLFTTDDYDDPRLKAYRAQCPKLELNKHRGFARVDPEDVLKTLREEGVPEDRLDEELDKYASEISYGTKNFKLYRVEFDGNPKNGEEYVFYDQSWSMTKPEKYAGPLSDPGRGTYALVDFAKCSIRGGVAAGGVYGPMARSARYHGIIKYRGHHYIFALEATDPQHGNLKLEGFGKDRTGKEKLLPVCAY